MYWCSSDGALTPGSDNDPLGEGGGLEHRARGCEEKGVEHRIRC